METTQVEHQTEEAAYRLTVSQVTVLIGMKRTRLKIEGDQAQEADLDRRLLRLFTYPDLAAAVVGAELRPAGEAWQAAPAGWPDFETFLGLPDALVARWEQAVYARNPHWLPEQAGAEKKEVTSSTPG